MKKIYDSIIFSFLIVVFSIAGFYLGSKKTRVDVFVALISTSTNTNKLPEQQAKIEPKKQPLIPAPRISNPLPTVKPKVQAPVVTQVNPTANAVNIPVPTQPAPTTKVS